MPGVLLRGRNGEAFSQKGFLPFSLTPSLPLPRLLGWWGAAQQSPHGWEGWKWKGRLCREPSPLRGLRLALLAVSRRMGFQNSLIRELVE